MNKKRSLIWSCLAVLAGLGSMPTAQAADDPAWYLGAGVGRADVKRSSSWAAQTDAGLLTRGITSSTQIESHAAAWKLFGGYRFNEFVAVEGGYQNLGRFNGVSTISAPAASSAGGKWDASAISVAAVATYPLGDRFGLLFKGGLAATRLKASVSQFNANETRVQPLLGIGVKFDATKVIGVRAEFERYNNVGDGSTTGQSPINIWSVSALYRF